MTADSLFGAGEFLPERGDGTATDAPRSSSRDGTSFRRMMLFAGRSSLDLAERIADELGVALGESTLKTFPNTETVRALQRVGARLRRLPRSSRARARATTTSSSC